MKRNHTIIMVLVVAVLVQMACSFPKPQSTVETPVFVTPTVGLPVITATRAAPAPQPQVVTATPVPQVQQPTATQPASTGSNNIPSTGACTFQATFIADVTIPDDMRVSPGASFTKTWRVRNDGTCTWGPSKALNALAFTGGSHLSGPDQVSLGGNVAPGQTVDLSVGLVAPASAGVYTSEWKFRVDGVSGTGPFIGLGTGKVDPLYARIVVGATPTAGPTATPTNTPVASTRIEFATGATNASADGSVKAGGTRSFVISAGKDQLMTASITSLSSDLSLKIVQSSTGKVLVSVNGSSAQTYLPANGDYLVQVIGGSTDASFVLGVTIPRRITFESGATSASVDGKISSRQPVMYTLRAQAGQTMTVKLTSPSNGLALTIYGIADGSPLVRADFGLSEWSGVLNTSQDYMIIAMPTVDSTTFTMTVTVK